MILVTQSAGMIYPRKQYVPLQGREYCFLELQVENVGEIETEFESILGTPDARLAESTEIVKRRGDFPKEVHIKHMRKIVDGYSNWPPRFGSEDFSEAMATREGEAVFLRVMFTRTNPGVTSEEIGGLMAHMTLEENDAIYRIAWGIRPWMSYAGANEDSNKSSGSRGIEWGKEIDALSRERGWTYDQIGKMFVSQFFNARVHGEPVKASLVESSPN